MSEPIIVTRDHAILGFLRIAHPEKVAQAERLVDELTGMGVKGIEPAPPVSEPESGEQR